MRAKFASSQVQNHLEFWHTNALCVPTGKACVFLFLFGFVFSGVSRSNARYLDHNYVVISF